MLYPPYALKSWFVGLIRRASVASGIVLHWQMCLMAMPMSAAFSAMIITIAPAFTIATLIGFTLIPATVVAIIMTPPAVLTPFIIAMPVVTVAPVTTVPVITA